MQERAQHPSLFPKLVGLHRDHLSIGLPLYLERLLPWQPILLSTNHNCIAGLARLLAILFFARRIACALSPKLSSVNYPGMFLYIDQLPFQILCARSRG